MYNSTIQSYNDSQYGEDRSICNILAKEISLGLPEAENKIWHSHPVWFIGGNPIVGYSKLKDSIRLFFWSGASFDEEHLKINTGKFKDASILFTSAEQINIDDINRWLAKSRNIQWDYKNLMKRKGKLERLK